MKKIAMELLRWIGCFVIAFVLAFVVKNTLIANAVVVSSSMESTIMKNSRVICSRLTYLQSDPKRFDIILFQPPDDETSVPYVKRVIGLPAEKVEIRDGKVYIDDSGVPLDDSFINEEARGNFGPFLVPGDSYFVLGDNRNHSFDSKNWVNKYVPKDRIIGRVCVEYFPTLKVFD